MLVLKRRDGQSIEIKPGVEVIVLKSRKGEVKLGVIAPAEVRVHRKNVTASIPTVKLPSDNQESVQ